MSTTSVNRRRNGRQRNGEVSVDEEDGDQYTNMETNNSSGWKLISYEMLPKWMKDNHFLTDGYRPPLGSMKTCFSSIFRMHTETGNIWTHLVGFVLFMFLWSVQMQKLDHLVDQVILSCFFIGAIICLGLSTTYHTCSCHSQPVGKLFHKLDYCGISTLILGSFIPTIYYSFYHNYFLKCVYIIVISALTAIAIIVSLFDRFGTPQFRPLRAAVFLTSGLSGLIPGFHWYLTVEPDILWSFYCLVTQGALYVIGALLYAMRIPERFFPGRCNYYCQSHQFFHILVVIAALVHLNGLQHLITYRVNAHF